jgi:hypothetical protein
MDKALWLETTATIYTCGWHDTPWYYLGSGNYIVVFSYKVNGDHYSGEYDDVTPATEGSQFSLRYNPDNPKENEKSVAMKRERLLTAIAFALVPTAFVIYEWYRGWK